MRHASVNLLYVVLLFVSFLLYSCGGGSSPSTTITSLEVDQNPSPAPGTKNSFAYVLGWTNSTPSISAFRIDATSGTLTPVGTLDSPNSYRMAVHPNGKFAYVIHSKTVIDVTAYRINADGSFTSIQTPISLGSINVEACCITVHPSGNFLYVGRVYGGIPPDQVEQYVLTYAISATTGALSYVGRSLVGTFNLYYNYSQVSSIVIDPSGRFAYAPIAGSKPGTSAIRTYTIDSNNGALTQVVTPNLWSSVYPLAMVMDPGGKLAYVAFLYDPIYYPTIPRYTDAIQAYTIDDSGALTEVGSAAPAGATPYGMVFEPIGRMLYSANQGGDVWKYSMDPVTGLTSEGPAALLGPPSDRSICIDSSGKFIYVANTTSGSIYAYAVNPQTGALTSIGAPVSTVPTPLFITTVTVSN
jgi:6-phosphogluconolactonase